MNDHEAQRIAAAMHELRPDWPTNSLLTLIRKHLIDKPRRDVTVALSWIACESNSATPARVLENGPWWRAAGVESTATATARFDPATCCTVCSKPDDGRHPEDHRFQSEHDRRKQLGHEGDTEAERIERAKEWARQGIGDAKAVQEPRPEPEPLPPMPEVERLRALNGGRPDLPPEDRANDSCGGGAPGNPVDASPTSPAGPTRAPPEAGGGAEEHRPRGRRAGMSEHKDLRRLAEAAREPIGWYAEETLKSGTTLDPISAETDAALIAATSPEVVLALLDDLDAAHAEVEALRGKLAAVEELADEWERWSAGYQPLKLAEAAECVRAALDDPEPAPGGVGGRSGGREGLEVRGEAGPELPIDRLPKGRGCND